MEMISHLLITYLANGVWMACLIAGAAALLASLLRSCSSAHLHALWAAVLLCSALLPLTSLWNAPTAHDRAPRPLVSADVDGEAQQANESPATAPFWLRIRRPLRPIPFGPFVTGSVSVLYLVFVVYRSLSLVWVWQGARRIRDDATPCLLSEGSAILRSCDSALRSARVSVVSSSDVHAPSVLGWFRPVLVLPDWFMESCSEEEIASALRHELAHVRRHDFPLNLMYEVFLLPLSFHPAAWFIKKRIEHTRELACDAIAAKQLSSPAVYARSLVSVAQRIAKNSCPIRSNYALSLFNTNTLEERIMNIVSKKQRTRKTRMHVRLALAISLFVAICAAAPIASIQVAMAAAPEDTTRFGGTWEGKFKGRTFVTVRLASKDGKVSGTVSRVNLEMDASGNLTDASAQDGEDQIAETTPQGDVLHIATKAKGSVDTASGESDELVQYDMTLTSKDEGELQIAGAPPGMPAPKPWKLEKAQNTK